MKRRTLLQWIAATPFAGLVKGKALPPTEAREAFERRKARIADIKPTSAPRSDVVFWKKPPSQGLTSVMTKGTGVWRWVPNDRPLEKDGRIPYSTYIYPTYDRCGKINGWRWEENECVDFPETRENTG